MRGLGTTYGGISVVSNLSDWYAFVSGFNMVDPMFDYLDAGSGKECADDKIKSRCHGPVCVDEVLTFPSCLPTSL
jgi:hypothetical protein